MPYGYRKRNRRYAKRSGRTYRGRRRITSKYSRYGRRKINTNVYYFKRKTQFLFDWVKNMRIESIDAPQIFTPYLGNFAFRLMDVASHSDFTALYDSYRIRGVKVNFIPVNNVSTWTQFPGHTGGQTAYVNSGNMAIRSYTAFDPNNDGVGVTSLNDIQQYQNCRWSPYNRIVKRFVRPRITMNVADGPNPVNIAGKQPWIPCSDGGATLHYGMPFVIDPTGMLDGTLMYKMELTYYLQFARPK